MCLCNLVSLRILLAGGLVLGMLATAAAEEQTDPKEVTINGKFVAFKDGILKFKVQNPKSDAWSEGELKVGDEIKVVSHIRGVAKEGTARDAFKQWEPGAVIVIKVKDKKATLIEIGIKPAADKAPDKSPDKPGEKAPEKAPKKAPEKTPDKAESKEAPKQRTVKGEFASFEDGTLTIKVYTGDSRKGDTPELRTESIPAGAQTLLWNHDERKLQPVDTLEAMRQLTALVAPVDASQVETAETMLWRKAGAGLVVQIANDKVTIRIGESRIPPFVGNLLSFKDDYLLFRFKDPSPQLQRNYGDSVRFKMNETIPVYESIDGGEYQRVGTPREAFAKVKEGSVVTVFHNYKTETDEFYLVLVGLKKK